MPRLVVGTATLTCSMGASPASLTVVRPRVLAGKKPVANVRDHVPTVNVGSFGLCRAGGNPAVVAATAAALGVFTPAACVPATSGPWSPGATRVTVERAAALHDGCLLTCGWGGTVRVQNAGQTKVEVR